MYSYQDKTSSDNTTSQSLKDNMDFESNETTETIQEQPLPLSITDIPTTTTHILT